MATDEQSRAEREQTDESLRVERAIADDALGEKLAAIDWTADTIIARARARADEVLARARAKVDRKLAPTASAPASPSVLDQERAREDRALREERATADETVRAERAQQLAVLATERNDTDRDLLSERARADDAVATRDEFLAIVSHDLRNMLSGMVGFAQAIARTAGRDENAAKVIASAERIQRTGARMDRLIGDLVDVASIEAGMLAVNPEAADAAAVVTEAVESFQAPAAARGVSLTADLTPHTSEVRFDPARILQVLTNLLSNAIKFTPAGGHVVVRLDAVDAQLRFSVSDTGQGIPREMLEMVFERFLQLGQNDRRGVGLGLYISRCIIEGHGGRIWAESNVGEGSTFRFTLPLRALHAGG